MNRRRDDLEKSQQSDHARLNELQQNHIPELNQALQLQKKRVEHLTELIDLSAQTQAEPTIDDPILHRAGVFPGLMIRTLDAIHVASAAEFEPPR